MKKKWLGQLEIIQSGNETGIMYCEPIWISVNGQEDLPWMESTNPAHAGMRFTTERAMFSQHSSVWPMRWELATAISLSLTRLPTVWAIPYVFRDECNVDEVLDTILFPYVFSLSCSLLPILCLCRNTRSAPKYDPTDPGTRGALDIIFVCVGCVL